MNKVNLLKKQVLLTALVSFAVYSAHSQSTPNPPNSHNSVYFSSRIDPLIISSALMAKNGNSKKLTVPRFTSYESIGGYINYDFSNHFGFFIGLNIKNIGFIEKIREKDSTVIRRDYTLGIPIGLKFGDVKEGLFGVVGGGIDFPFNYREKGFVKRGHKTKFNEWFSDRTPAAMGYVFAGIGFSKGLRIKIQYYPGNFLNPDFKMKQDGVNIQPYKNYDVNMLFISLSFNIRMTPPN